MASESSFPGQSIRELVGEKKVGDNTIEEEKQEPENVSVGYEIKKEEDPEQVGEIKNSLQESQASNSSEPANETNEGKSNDVVEIFTSKEPVNSEFKQDLNDAEIALTSENESKIEEVPLISNVEAETLETVNLQDTKDKVEELVRTEVPTIDPDTSVRPEDNGAGILDSVIVPVKDHETETSSSEKSEVSAETKDGIELIQSEVAKDELQESIPAKIPFDASEAPEKNDLDSITSTSIEVPVHDTDVHLHSPEEKKHEEDVEEKNDVDSITFTNTEVPVKDSDVDFGSSEEQKQAEGSEIKEPVKLIGSENLNEEVLELVPAKVFVNGSEAPEESDVPSSTRTAIEVPVKDLEVESGFLEEQEQADGAEITEHSDLIRSGNSNEEVEELVSPKVSINASEVSGKCDFDSSTLTTIEVPVKDLEVESGYPEEQNYAEGAGIKEHIEMIGSENSNNEVQELVSTEVSSDFSEAPEKSDVDSSTLSNIEVPAKDLEVESGYPEEQKSEGSAQTKVNFELVKPEDSKVGQEFVPAEILAALEKNDVDSSTPTSTEVIVKDLEVESGSPEEQKVEEILETKEPSSNATSIEGGGEVARSSSYEEKTSGVEVLEKKDEGIKDEVVQINTELPEDLTAGIEVKQTQSDENKVSEEGPVEEDTIFEGGLETSTVLDVVPPVAKSSSEDEKNSDLGEVVSEIKDESIETKVPEVLLEGNDLEVDNFVDKEKDVNVDTIHRGLAETSIDPIVAKNSDVQVQVTESVEEPLKVISNELNFSPESSEVPPEGERVFAGDEKSENLKDEGSTLVFESGSPELQKPEESAETKEPCLNETTINDGSEVVGSSSYEEKPSGVAELVENKDEGFRGEIIQTTDVFPDDLEARSEVDQTRPDEDEVSREGAVEDDRIIEGGLETSTVLDVAPPVAKVSSEDEPVSDLGEVVQMRNNGIDTVPEVSEVSLKGNISEEGNLVDEEKDVNVESVERGVAETSIHPIVAKGSSEQVQAPESVEKSMEPNESPVSDDVPLVGETVSAGDEKSESLKGEVSSLDETPQDITISDQSPEQFIDDKKQESSKSGANASLSSPEATKDIIASETYDENEDVTSKDLSLVETSVNVPENEEEAIVKETIENVTDKPEHEEFVAEKKESERAKDEALIVSSDTGDAKSIKEATKRESNIFTKVKRSILKAKKAILRKSPGPKTVSSEAKDEKI